MQLKLHTGLQYLILDKRNIVLDSVAWNIYDHAYRLASGERLHNTTKSNLADAILSRYPDSHMIQARVKGLSIIFLSPTKPYAIARADSPRTYDDIR